METKIILITGKKGSGKTTLQDNIFNKIWDKWEDYGCITELDTMGMSFADPLKQLLRHYHKDKLTKQTKDDYRKDLQEFGDLIRGKDKDFFVKGMINKINYVITESIEYLSDTTDLTIVIDDVRYPNEIQGLINAGLPIIKLYHCIKEDDEQNDSHPSENSFDEVLQIAKDNNIAIEEVRWSAK